MRSTKRRSDQVLAFVKVRHAARELHGPKHAEVLGYMCETDKNTSTG